MTRSQAIRAIWPLALTAASAELAVRTLSPREPAPPCAPIDLHDHFSAEEIRRGARYARPQLAIGVARAALDAGVLAAIVARRRPAGSRPALSGAGLSAVLSLPGLPLAALARRRAIAVGLATQSWRGWASDLLKGTAIQTVFAGAGSAGVVAVIRRWPRAWWLPAAAGSVGVGAGVATLAPVLLDPLFNDFVPLAEGQTRTDVLELARTAGVRVGQVYSVDASRRTTAANAYVTGLGPSKRVVLFDTLLDRYNRDQVRVVVAHELAHVRYRDVLRSVGFAALTAPAAALAVQRLSWELSPERGTAASLPALAMALAIVTTPLGVAMARLSRRLERRADAFSLELAGAPAAFVAFEREIALQNVADVDPPRVVSFLSTHPSTGERIGMAIAYQNQAG